MANNPAAALVQLNSAITAVEAARDLLTDVDAFTGNPNEPGSSGFFGTAIDDLKVLRGRVALNDGATVFQARA